MSDKKKTEKTPSSELNMLGILYSWFYLFIWKCKSWKYENFSDRWENKECRIVWVRSIFFPFKNKGMKAFDVSEEYEYLSFIHTAMCPF